MTDPYYESGPFAQAPYPVVPTQSARPSRKTSVERPRQTRSPNDVRVKPASTNVLDGLLASFDDIDFSPDAPPPPQNQISFSRPRTPTRPSVSSSRPASRSSFHIYPNFSRNISKPPSIRAQTTHDFAEASYPVPGAQDLDNDEDDDDDVAEAPVVRTARPPSGFSKMTSQPQSASRSLARKTSTPRVLRSPNPERSSLQSSRPESRERPQDGRAPLSGNLSPQRLGSVRESIDSDRWEGDAYDLNPPTSPKGKERDVYSPRSRSMRSAAYDLQRAPPLRSTSRQDYTASIGRARTMDSQQTPVTPVAARSSQSRPRTAREREEDERERRFSQTPGSKDGRNIPERRSSRNATASNSPAKRRSSVPSASSSPDAQRVRSPEPTEQVPKPVVVGNSADTDVERRIKELQAARDQRLQKADERKNSFQSKPFSMDDEPLPSPSLRRPTGISSRPSQQFKSAEEVEEHKISDEAERDRDNYALNAPPTFTAASAPRSQSRMQSEVPKGVTSGSAVVISNRAPSRPSFDSPAKTSRSNSKSKRWSPLPFATRDATRSAGSDPPASPGMRKSTSLADTRSSLDSVSARVRDYLSSPRLTRKLYIPGEGRAVVFSEVGDPNGYAVFCCVGMGLTRYIMAFYDELATSLGLRLITPDRPGIGGSDQYRGGPRTPLSWPDDVQAICDHLQITHFSLLAHSAGAIYALATALRLPHYLRGKIQLLAPWIPPSQLTPDAVNSRSSQPAGNLPRSQRFLRILPSAFLKLSNASFSRSSSNTSKPPKEKPEKSRSRPYGSASAAATSTKNLFPSTAPTLRPTAPPSPTLDSFRHLPSAQHTLATALHPTTPSRAQREKAYDAALTPQIWDLATRNANPSVDLLICLERHRTIGFSYAEVGASPPTKTLAERPGRLLDLGAEVDGNQWPGMGVVIRHGSRDGRVPVENVRWLGGRMVKCSVLVLEGLGHGLMGEAVVMGGVLAEISREWAENGERWGRAR